MRIIDKIYIFALNKIFNFFYLKIVEKKEEDDMDYSIQYFNNFQSLGYRLNDMVYHIWENKIVSSICKPIETKKLSKLSGRLVRVSIFEELIK